mgnify:CR=1 FL=1
MRVIRSIVLSSILLVNTSLAQGIILNEAIDGDTIRATLDSSNPILNKIYIRLHGVDTPELFHPQCEEEKRLALEAKNYLQSIILSNKISIRILGWDKYGGRVLAELYTEHDSISSLLIDKQLGIPYHGDRKTHSWCQHDSQ